MENLVNTKRRVYKYDSIQPIRIYPRYSSWLEKFINIIHHIKKIKMETIYNNIKVFGKAHHQVII